MPECYRSNIDRAHDHKGPPFYRCRSCGKIMCYNCIGRNLSSGGKLCVECAASTDPSSDISRRHQAHRRANLNNILKNRSFPSLIDLLGKILYAISNATAFAFTKAASILLVFLSNISSPFRNRSHDWQASRPGFDLSFTNFKDKARFTLWLVGIVVLITIGAFLYAEIRGVSLYMVLITIIASCICWGMTSVYLQSFFDAPLGRPVSQILAYVISFFIALLFGIWLLHQSWLVKIIG